MTFIRKWLSALITVKMWVLLVCLQVVLKSVASLNEANNICTVCRCSTQEDAITGIPQSLIDCSFMDFVTVLDNVNLPLFSLSLNLNHNNLSIISKELFSEWNPLKMLTISYNNLRELSERAFDNFNGLNSLDLSHNNLTVLAEHLFDVQVELERLDLCYNNITELPEELFKHSLHLRVLSLGHNKLLGSTISNTHLRSAFKNGLQTLYLNDIGLRVVLSDLFDGATAMTELYLDDNPLTVVPGLFVPSLVKFSLSGTHVSKVAAGAFLFTPNLRQMHMDDSLYLTEVQENAFDGLPGLNTLSLRRCSRLSHLAAVLPPSLLELSVAWSGLTTLQPSVFKHLDENGSLDLRGNLWNCDCHLSWLHDFKPAQNIQFGVTCFLPRRLRGHLLQDTKAADLSCSSDTRHRGVLIAVNVLATAAVVVVISLVSVLGWKKYGESLTSLWRPRTPVRHYARVHDSNM